MRHGSTSPFFHRQSRLGSVQRLDLRLFIDTQHEGFIRRIQIQTDHVGQFLNKPFVLGQLERLGSMGLQPMGIPYARHAGVAHAQFLGHHSGTPVSRSRRSRLESRLHNRFHFLGIQTLSARTMGSIFRQSQKSLVCRNRSRQSRTVGRDVPSSLAMALLDRPSAARRQILDRKTILCGVVPARIHPSSVFLCSIVIGKASVGFHMTPTITK